MRKPRKPHGNLTALGRSGAIGRALWQAALSALLLAAAPALPAGAAECRLGLVLGLDVSASVDMREHALLVTGTAAALTDPEVEEAILVHGGVYAAAYEWSGQFEQRVIAPWSLLDSGEAIRAFAARIADTPRGTSEFPTALGAALGYGHTLLRRGPPFCARRVLDMAGDGENNHGFEPRHAYAAFDFADITVNGLVIAGASPTAVTYYLEEVIRGPGAFVEVADGYEAFAEAMTRKLLREIRPLSVSDAR